VSDEPPNMRMKLTACDTLTHGKKRRRSHAAAYPRRYADVRIMRKFATWLLCALVLCVVACAHAAVNTAANDASSQAATSDHSRIVFVVASAQGGQLLPGVKVSLVGRDGAELELGKTDSSGRLQVLKATLHEYEAQLILFSRESFFTGAIRVQGSGLDFYSFDERFIQLAAFGLI
jgi:hypothetical protein